MPLATGLNASGSYEIADVRDTETLSILEHSSSGRFTQYVLYLRHFCVRTKELINHCY